MSSNAEIQQPNGVGIQRHPGQIIPRPKNDGLSATNQRNGERYRNDVITDNKLSNNDANRHNGRGSSTLSKSQRVAQHSGPKNSNSNSGFLSRYIC